MTETRISCRCGEPLLRAIAGTGQGEGSTHWYEYRTVAAGPQSEPITVCSGCGVTLSDETIREIEDA